MKKEKVYVSKDRNLRLEVIWSHYNVLAAEHRERQKTTELMMRNYWWSGVTRNVGRYVKKCNLCQRIKNRTEASVGKLMVNEVLKKAWTHLTVDFITKLLLVVEKYVILIVCNQLSKMAHFMITTGETSAKELARLFRDNV